MNTWDHWDASWGSRVRSSRWTRTRLEWVALNKSVHFNKAKFSDKPSCHIKALMRTRSLILNQWLRCGKSNLDLVSLSLVYLQIALAYYCMLCSVPSERKHSSSCINEYSDNYCRSSIFLRESDNYCRVYFITLRMSIKKVKSYNFYVTGNIPIRIRGARYTIQTLHFLNRHDHSLTCDSIVW